MPKTQNRLELFSPVIFCYSHFVKYSPCQKSNPKVSLPQKSVKHLADGHFSQRVLLDSAPSWAIVFGSAPSNSSEGE